MDITDLVRALLAYDALGARQWVADATRRRLIWRDISRPDLLSETELAVAAGIAEVLAERAGEPPPAWADEIGSSPRAIFLVRAAEVMPRLRRSCELEGPEPLRRRQVFAPPDFLTVA